MSVMLEVECQPELWVEICILPINVKMAPTTMRASRLEVILYSYWASSAARSIRMDACVYGLIIVEVCNIPSTPIR